MNNVEIWYLIGYAFFVVELIIAAFNKLLGYLYRLALSVDLRF
jgi:hypothetical protein